MRARRKECRSVLARLTSLAFVDCRATAAVGAHLIEIEGLSDLDRIRMLADMFHNDPALLGTAAGPDDIQRFLDELWRADPDRRAWLDGAVAYLSVDRSSALFSGWA